MTQSANRTSLMAGKGVNAPVRTLPRTSLVAAVRSDAGVVLALGASSSPSAFASAAPSPDPPCHFAAPGRSPPGRRRRLRRGAASARRDGCRDPSAGRPQLATGNRRLPRGTSRRSRRRPRPSWSSGSRSRRRPRRLPWCGRRTTATGAAGCSHRFCVPALTPIDRDTARARRLRAAARRARRRSRALFAARRQLALAALGLLVPSARDDRVSGASAATRRGRHAWRERLAHEQRHGEVDVVDDGQLQGVNLAPLTG